MYSADMAEIKKRVYTYQLKELRKVSNIEKKALLKEKKVDRVANSDLMGG